MSLAAGPERKHSLCMCLYLSQASTGIAAGKIIETHTFHLRIEEEADVYREVQQQLTKTVQQVLKSTWDIDLETVPVEQPPDLSMGEFALPVAFELARKLRKAPRMIAAELAAKLRQALTPETGFASFEAAGAGYINVRVDRAGMALALAADGATTGTVDGKAADLRILVEHTSINPNKAAHVGHLRNAILGDTLVRILRAAGYSVDVQNYIDNTGVQVADVVVGFLHVEGKSRQEIDGLMARCDALGAEAREGRFDYLCWDLYARVSQWYSEGTEEQQRQRKALRYETLHAIERGESEVARVADSISTAVLRLHLLTMQRLGIEYDFLPRESEILHLKFWDRAFDLLKQSGVLYHESQGKNAGCWVMTRPDAKVTEGETDEDAKVIVRSNGTVTYVGKDIAYHLWKFGLLGADFGYRKFFEYPRHTCWISSTEGDVEHPHFGGAGAIYNVIDSRQSDPQANVVQALRGMGHQQAANRYTHFSYEMVALTPRCAMELGYHVSEEDQGRAYIEVSGRKGFGVKADDLLDKLTAATRSEVDARQPERAEAERQMIAKQIAIGALRYFMLKFTRGSVIAFDFKDALSFEGETGPYVQYTAVRARNIFRKAETTPEQALEAMREAGAGAMEDDVLWAIWLRAARREQALAATIQSAEPATIARHGFQLAQEFNNFYHKHHILTEEDPARRTLLLATAAVALRELTVLLHWMGIDVPEAM